MVSAEKQDGIDKARPQYDDPRPACDVEAERRKRSDSARGKVLLIAYHFPPDASSTGRLRTLGFMRHLPAFGWEPFVLTAHPRAYERTDADGVKEIPGLHRVKRAFALDTSRHVSWRGKYFSGLAIPDRWISWWPAAVRSGWKTIRERQIDVIWSTYPIMTSHLIALTLARMTGLPWIADFRDPVVPADERLNQRVNRWIEQRVIARANRVVFTTPGAMQQYRQRFPKEDSSGKFMVIPNGYEEEVFASINGVSRYPNSPCTLIHAGVLYRDGRNPVPFFEALAGLKSRHKIDAHTLRIVLRASGSETYYQEELGRLDIADLVELAPPIGYRAALAEQASADGLLLFQGTQFNSQIPAKVYEYLRLGVPIFALIDSAGDTAAVLRDTGGAYSAPMENDTEIATALENFLEGWKTGDLKPADRHMVQSYARDAGVEKLAGQLNEVVREPRYTENS